MGTMLLKDINKIYPNGVQAVFDFNMEIEDGEFIVLVGPSGCGKSTTLRMIAGLEEISSGTLEIDQVVSNNLAPKDRDIAMVFQNYALYSHMTVYHNMAFSLVLRKVNSDLIHERVMWAAEILGLKPYLNRRPQQLSGGQRQRVAVGRALVRDPKVFLLDEPLSNLDAKLRGSMRNELKLLHNRLGKTMIYVTHDQIEALTLADRIVIMNNGYIQQIGTPYEVYNNPCNLFVATFIGTPPMNTYPTQLTEAGELFFGDYKLDIKTHKDYEKLEQLGYVGKELVIGIRPEHVSVKKTDQRLISKVDLFELFGAEALIHFKLSRKLDLNSGYKYEFLKPQAGSPNIINNAKIVLLKTNHITESMLKAFFTSLPKQAKGKPFVFMTLPTLSPDVINAMNRIAQEAGITIYFVFIDDNQLYRDLATITQATVFESLDEEYQYKMCGEAAWIEIEKDKTRLEGIKRNIIAKTSDVMEMHSEDLITFNFEINHIYFFDKETGLRI